MFHLDADVTTWFSDELWEASQSIMGVLTHVYLQSWKTSAI